MSSSAVIVLHPSDNVVVCRRNVTRGEQLSMGNEVVVADSDVALGHKIALRLIPAGSLVIKYGMSIGSATVDVRPGQWVHMHNLKSDYIPSHTRERRV